MRKESVLEFTLNEELYCFNTQHIAYVFDLEEYENISGIDECLLGLVRYNDDVMPLIDTLCLYDSTQHVDFSEPKSVVVIKSEEDSGLFGLVVDEIIKIEDVEIAPASLDLSSEELVIHHYKDKEKLINEIVPLPLLKARGIAPMHKKTKRTQLAVHHSMSEFLLFCVGDKKFAVYAKDVKEVVQKEGEAFMLQDSSQRFKGAVSIRNRVVKIADIGMQSMAEDVTMIVVGRKEASFCIEADEVMDIVDFELGSIQRLPESKTAINSFYSIDEEVIAIVDTDFFADALPNKEEDNSKTVLETTTSHSLRHGYLVVDIAQKRFVLDMRSVRQVLETHEVAKAKSAAMGGSSFIEFIATWNNHAVEVISIESLLQLQKRSSAQQTVILQEREHYKGLLVDDIEDILYVEQGDVAKAASQSIIDGAVISDERLFPKLNISKIVELR